MTAKKKSCHSQEELSKSQRIFDVWFQSETEVYVQRKKEWGGG